MEGLTTPMHVGSVMVFQPRDGGFDYDGLVALISNRISLVPRYRQCVREVPGRLANPVWVDDEHFDVTYHVRRSALPRPGSDDQLQEFVARIQSRRLDRGRPLWEVYLIEGLARGRFAIVTKSHQALVDGINALDIANVIVDGTTERDDPVAETWRPAREPSDVELVASAFVDAVRRPSQVADTVRGVMTDVKAVGGPVFSALGAVVSKGLFLAEREGHPAPRIVETPAGMINAIGLQGIGAKRFVSEKLPELRDRRATVIVNVCGTTIDEYAEVSRIVSDAEGVHGIELNISCPNIKEGGIQFGCSLIGTHDVVAAVRRATRLPIIPKLTPNVTDVASFARASEEAGADAVSLVNTFLALALDVETRRPKISNGMGGLSGPAIRPIAVRMVYECQQMVKIPVIGMGGIADARDALEFIIAGSTAVQIGTANFVDPLIWAKLTAGVTDYLTRHRMARVTDLIGTARMQDC